MYLPNDAEMRSITVVTPLQNDTVHMLFAIFSTQNWLPGEPL